MSEKEKRDLSSTESADAARFKDIVKMSEDILKTAYPPEENEEEKGKKPINPFVEEKPPKNKLSADFSPDGKVLIEDNPEREKTFKERSKEEEKNKIRLARQNLRREKLLIKIKKLEPKLALIKKKKDDAEGTPDFDKYLKKEARLSKKIDSLNQRAVSPEQFTPNSGFYIKAHMLKIWVIVLVLLVAVIIALSTALFFATYKDLTHFRGDSENQRKSVSKLSNEVQTLNEEKTSVTEENDSLQQKIAELEKEVEAYEKENEELQTKADFLESHIYILNGNFFSKTYHKYGCDEIDYSSFQAYNKELVEGRLGYSACTDCIG